MRGRITGYSILGLVLGVSFAANTLLTNRLERQPTQSYIVQATSLQQAGADNDRWDGSHTASDGYLWNDGMLWNDSTVTPVSITTWIEQE